MATQKINPIQEAIDKVTGNKAGEPQPKTPRSELANKFKALLDNSLKQIKSTEVEPEAYYVPYEGEKILLPSFEKYKAFVGLLPYAELVYRDLTDQQTIDGEQPKLEWSGPIEGVCYIGYPFERTEVTYGADDLGEMTKVVGQSKTLPDLGIPLHRLFYSVEHHAFACVRSDVYDIR